MARRPPLSERIRLIRLLRTHGLRAVERLRADELKLALDKLGLTLPAEDEPHEPHEPYEPHDGEAESAPSSPSLQRQVPEPTPPRDEERPLDPMNPKFKEPPPFLPEGDRSFVRLIAVDPGQLFITWDLSREDRALVEAGAHLKLRVDEEGTYEHGDFILSERIDPRANGWYLRAPEERTRLVAALTTLGGDLVAVSNPAIVPPSRPAPEGPLRFASVPVGIDRRRLRGGLLLRALFDDEADLPEGVEVSEAGRTVRARVSPDIGAAPSSSARIPLSQGVEHYHLGPPAASPPSSHLYKAPSSSGMRR